MIEKPLAFIGKIIADFTHEINNNLTIIKESAGLINDICRTKESIDKKNISVIIDTLNSIEQQIIKTVNFLNYFNRFAHRMDHLKSKFNIQEVLEELFELLKKHTNRKNVRLRYNFSSDLPEIENSPFIIQLVIFYVIDIFLRRALPNATISIDANSENHSVKISIKYEGEFINILNSEEIWNVSTIEDIALLADLQLIVENHKALIII